MNELTLVPDVEKIYEDIRRNKFEIEMYFNQMDQAGRDGLKSFFRDNAKKDFRYFTKALVVKNGHGDVLYARDLKSVRAEDESGISVWFDDEFQEQVFDAGSGVQTIEYTFGAEGFLYLIFSYYGEGNYAVLTGENFEVRVSAQDGQVVMAITKENHVQVVSIPVETERYWIADTGYDVIVVVLSWNSAKWVLAHNGEYKEIEVSGQITDVDVSFTDVFDVIIADLFVPGEYIDEIAAVIDGDVTITVNGDEVDFSKEVDWEMYGRYGGVFRFLMEILGFESFMVEENEYFKTNFAIKEV